MSKLRVRHCGHALLSQLNDFVVVFGSLSLRLFRLRLNVFNSSHSFLPTK